MPEMCFIIVIWSSRKYSGVCIYIPVLHSKSVQYTTSVKERIVELLFIQWELLVFCGLVKLPWGNPSCVK